MDEVQSKNTVSLNISHALFCPLFKRDNLAKQVLVCLHVVWFGTVYMDLRWPHLFKYQI